MYKRQALGAGDSAVVIATKAHRDGLAQRLRARGFDLSTARLRGQYVALDAAETLSEFMVDGWPDEGRFTTLMGDVIADVYKRQVQRQTRVGRALTRWEDQDESNSLPC